MEVRHAGFRMFVLIAEGRKGGQFLAAVCDTEREAMAVADRVGGLKIIGPLASVVIPHTRWRLCKVKKAEDKVGGHNLSEGSRTQPQSPTHRYHQQQHHDGQR
jgi:hypothetical protein